MVTASGFSAAFLTTAAYVPQVIRTFRTRSGSDLSLATFIILTAGLVLWVIYGALVENVPILFANSVTLLLSVAILYGKARYRLEPPPHLGAEQTR